jgi:hypothetical protein
MTKEMEMEIQKLRDEIKCEYQIIAEEKERGRDADKEDIKQSRVYIAEAKAKLRKLHINPTINWIDST